MRPTLWACPPGLVANTQRELAKWLTGHEVFAYNHPKRRQIFEPNGAWATSKTPMHRRILLAAYTVRFLPPPFPLKPARRQVTQSIAHDAGTFLRNCNMSWNIASQTDLRWSFRKPTPEDCEDNVFKPKWGAVFCDEGHAIKNDSKRAAAMAQILINSCDVGVCVTATPMANSVEVCLTSAALTKGAVPEFDRCTASRISSCSDAFSEFLT